MTNSLHLGGYDLLDGTPTVQLPGTVYPAHYEAFPIREGVRDDISIFGLTVNANLGFADLTSATSYFGRLGYQTQDASANIYWMRTKRQSLPPIGTAVYRGYTVRADSLRRTRSVPPADPGNPLDLARCRRLALGGGRLLQQSAFGVERDQQQSAGCHCGPCSTRRLVIYFLERLRGQTDRAICRRVVQVHRAMEALRGGALLRLREPPGRVLVGLRRPQLHAARELENYHRQEQRRESASQPIVRARSRFDRVCHGVQGLPPGRRQPDPAAADLSRRSASRAPCQFGPDSVWNYEIGEKARFFDSWLTDQQRRLLHQVERHPAGDHAAVRLSVL